MKFTAASLSALAVARVLADGVGTGPGMGFPSAAGQKAAAEAGRHPNATNAVTFQSTIGNKQVSLTWRVNITELPLPNGANEYDYGKPGANYSEGLHVINTQWQLQWPHTQGSSNGSFASYLQENDASNVLLQMFTLDTSSDITQSWTNPSDGDCASVLGQACVVEMQQTLQHLNNNFTAYSAPACNKTTFAKYWGPNSNLVSTSSDPQYATNWFSDDAMYYYTTNYTDASNTTAQYQYAESTLQILTLTFYDEHNVASTPSIVCQVLCKNCTHEPQSSSAGALSSPLTLASGLLVGVGMLLAAL